MTSPPPDALVARAIRALTRVLLAGCVAAVALGLAAGAVLALSGASGTAVGPVLSLLAVGQAAALATAWIGAAALLRVLRPGAPAGTTGASGATADDAAAAVAARAATARRLVVLARVTGVGCVLAVAAWVLADPGAALGALLGGLVAAQVAVLDVVLARRLARRPAPTR